MTKKAFTLIELLVVLAILGVILVLLFPAIGKARESARRAMCANNLRQHGIAWYLYLDDHDELFPQWGSPPNDIQCINYTFGGKSGYYSAPTDPRPLNRYLDVTETSAEIFHCPDDIIPQPHYPETTFNITGNSYVMNDWILSYQVGTSTRRPLRTITSPHSKVYLEQCSAFVFPGHGGKGYVYPKTPVMILFVDGHVKGPYFYTDDFDNTWTGQYPAKPVYSFPNTTPAPYD